MKFKKFSKEFMQSGQIARLLLVLAIIVFVAGIITFLVLRMAEKPAAPVSPTPQSTVPLPVYEAQLGNIRFVFESALDQGTTLSASAITNPQYQSSYTKDLVTTEKYIIVTIGAQNKGKENIEANSWDLGNIIDSQGRNFVPVEGYTINPWLPETNGCGTLLKPAFNPVPCTKIYEVSKQSSGLKINIETGVDNTSNNFTSGKISSTQIDLIVR